MPAGREVRPGKWTDVIDLFDNGHYAAVWGRYGDDSERRCLGVRWNWGEPGFPSQGGNPLWYVEPEFVTGPILQALLTIVSERLEQQTPRSREYAKNVRIALQEFGGLQGLSD